MADVNLAVQQIDSEDGHTPTYQGSLSISDTYKIPHDDRTFLHFKKTGAGACTVTVQTPVTVRGKAVAEATFNVPATTGDVMVGPFPADLYRQGDGKINVTLSEVTGLTVGVFRL
jgi:hypothetical protein